MKRQIEIRCGNYSDALNAQNGGASRIILSNGLYLGGLTPSIGTLFCERKYRFRGYLFSET